jgi:uridine phosphorylase
LDTRLLADGALLLAGVRGIGAPATAVAIEEMAAAGVRRLVAVDVAASLVADVPSGSIVLVGSAIACDGTSPHYTAERLIHADRVLSARLRESLIAAGVAFAEAAAWSTDAVYRETPREIDEARREGAGLADMETACVFAVSSALGLEAAALLVAADELRDGWRPPADTRHVQAQVRRALTIATACLLP